MAFCGLVVISLCFGGTHCHHLLKIRVVGSSEFSANAYQAIWPHVPKNCTLHSYLIENLKSHFLFLGLCKFNCVLQCDKMLEYIINTNIHFWSGLKMPFVIIISKLNKVKLELSIKFSDYFCEIHWQMHSFTVDWLWDAFNWPSKKKE